MKTEQKLYHISVLQDIIKIYNILPQFFIFNCKPILTNIVKTHPKMHRMVHRHQKGFYLGSEEKRGTFYSINDLADTFKSVLVAGI